MAIVGSIYPAGDPGSGFSEPAVRTGPEPVSWLEFVNVSGPNTNLTPVPTKSLMVETLRMPITISTVCACNDGLKVASRHSVAGSQIPRKFPLFPLTMSIESPGLEGVSTGGVVNLNPLGSMMTRSVKVLGLAGPNISKVTELLEFELALAVEAAPAIAAIATALVGGN